MFNDNGRYDEVSVSETDEPAFVPAPLWDNVRRKSRLGKRGKLCFPGITSADKPGISTHVVKEPSLNFHEWLRQAPVKKLFEENKENAFCNNNESTKSCESRSKSPEISLNQNQYLKFWNDLDINKLTDPNGFINISKLSVNMPLSQPVSNNHSKINDCISENISHKPVLDERKNSFIYPHSDMDISPLNLSVPKIPKTELTNSTSSTSSFPLNNKNLNEQKLDLSNSTINSTCSFPLNKIESDIKQELAHSSSSTCSSSLSVKTVNKILPTSPACNKVELKQSNLEEQSKLINENPAQNVEFKFERPQPVLPVYRTLCQNITIQGVSYQVLNELGRGGSSKVYQVLNPNTNQLLAVKKVDLTDLDPMIADGYLNEVKLLNSLQHCESVIKMINSELVTTSRKKLLYVVMEKGETDLSKLIREINKTTKISISMIAHYWSEMLKAVEGIHKSGIIHSDLKPANFLLVSGRLKLIDFGIASKIQSDMTSVHKEFATGTWNYMSPEALKNTNSTTAVSIYKITYKSDVWSLGCILYNLVYGRTPFQHITHTLAKLQAIVDPSVEIQFPDKEMPPGLINPIKSCLQKDPKLRPTVCQLLNEVTTAFKYFGCTND